MALVTCSASFFLVMIRPFRPFLLFLLLPSHLLLSQIILLLRCLQPHAETRLVHNNAETRLVHNNAETRLVHNNAETRLSNLCEKNKE